MLSPCTITIRPYWSTRGVPCRWSRGTGVPFSALAGPAAVPLKVMPSAAAIRTAADAYKVYYSKVTNESGNDYTVDHTAFIYLMGTDGKYLGFFPPGTTPERIADILRQQTGSIR